MTVSPRSERPVSLARRHLFKVVATSGVRAAAAAGLSAALLPTSARAMGKVWWRHHHRYDDGPNTPSCLLRGTRIATSKGAVAIEDLQVEDLVLTECGEYKPIKWIGRQMFRRRQRAEWPSSVAPVCIKRFAFDEQSPVKDLYLSPSHAVFMEGVLIPVEHLVNGASIVECTGHPADELEYFHVELESHDVIYAEGVPVETFIGGCREHFTNFIEFERRYGEVDATESVPYAPRIGAYTGSAALKSLFGMLTSPFATAKDPVRTAYAGLAARARCLI